MTFALALSSAPLAAQPWVGTAAVGVQVSDRQGRPVPGAEVELVYGGSEERGGPGVVRTDAEGRAAVRGLAEGLWHLQVSHPDYMAYLANLNVRSGKRPREESASLVKVGDSLESVRVKYFEVEGLPRRPAPAPEPPPPPPPPPRRPAPAPVPPPSPPPAPVPAPMPPPAPAPMPEPAPMPTPAPMPMPPPPPPVQPEPAPAPEVMPEPPPVPSMPTPEPEPAPPPRVPTPAPAPEPPSPPPAMAPPPAPAPALLPAPPPGSLRSFRDGTCPECRPGEWVATVEVTVGGAGAACPDDLADRVARTASLAAGGGEAAATQAGAVGAAEPLAPFQDEGSRCRVTAVHLPEGARFVAFQFEAGGGAWERCLAGEPCPAGGGRWVVNPILKTDAAGTLVASAYENPEGAAPRPIRFTVFWVPPSRWSP